MYEFTAVVVKFLNLTGSLKVLNFIWVGRLWVHKRVSLPFRRRRSAPTVKRLDGTFVNAFLESKQNIYLGGRKKPRGAGTVTHSVTPGRQDLFVVHLSLPGFLSPDVLEFCSLGWLGLSSRGGHMHFRHTHMYLGCYCYDKSFQGLLQEICGWVTH